MAIIALNMEKEMFASIGPGQDDEDRDDWENDYDDYGSGASGDAHEQN